MLSEKLWFKPKKDFSSEKFPKTTILPKNEGGKMMKIFIEEAQKKLSK